MNDEFVERMTKAVADGWSQNCPLSELIAEVVRETEQRCGKEENNLLLTVPMIEGATQEIQLIGVLDTVCDRYKAQPLEVARAVRWLGTKYDPQYVEAQ